MVWRPDVTVAALVEREGRFLIVEERIRGRLVLNQPAGHLEANETLLQAVARETLEETAWHLTPLALLGVYLWPSPRGHTTLRFAFIGEVDRFEAERTLDPPVIAAHWLTLGELERRRQQLRTPLVLRCIGDYLSGRRLPLDAVTAVSPDAKPPAAPSPR
jgi:8-oxo-dGTP pyrophosphatase MutT (NUDIX family)